MEAPTGPASPTDDLQPAKSRPGSLREAFEALSLSAQFRVAAVVAVTATLLIVQVVGALWDTVAAGSQAVGQARAKAPWCRVVRPGGHVYLVVPDKRVSFDRHRVRTTLEHLIADYRRPSAERDFEHYLEYAALVHGAFGGAALAEADRLRTTRQSIHYHVFAPDDLVSLMEWFAGAVRPVSLVEPAATSPHHDEFHVLLRTA